MGGGWSQRAPDRASSNSHSSSAMLAACQRQRLAVPMLEPERVDSRCVCPALLITRRFESACVQEGSGLGGRGAYVAPQSRPRCGSPPPSPPPSSQKRRQPGRVRLPAGCDAGGCGTAHSSTVWRTGLLLALLMVPLTVVVLLLLLLGIGAGSPPSNTWAASRSCRCCQSKRAKGRGRRLAAFETRRGRGSEGERREKTGLCLGGAQGAQHTHANQDGRPEHNDDDEGEKEDRRGGAGRVGGQKQSRRRQDDDGEIKRLGTGNWRDPVDGALVQRWERSRRRAGGGLRTRSAPDSGEPGVEGATTVMEPERTEPGAQPARPPVLSPSARCPVSASVGPGARAADRLKGPGLGLAVRAQGAHGPAGEVLV